MDYRQFIRRNWIWLLALALGSFTVLWTAWTAQQVGRRVDALEVRVERLEGR